MELQLIIVSFIAGVLTILAPCIFPLLPILIGSSADTDKSDKKRNRAFTVVASLLISIAILTIILHGTSNALGLSTGTLRGISAVILIALGIVTVFPHIWERISLKLGFESSSNKMLAKAMSGDGKTKDILTGVALGPVFSSCSPTYGLIIATILPQEFGKGLIYLTWYLFGLGMMFFLIAVLGNKFASKLKWATDPNGWFKKSIGILFVFFGFAIMFGWDKDFEAWLLNLQFYENLVEFEFNLR